MTSVPTMAPRLWAGALVAALMLAALPAAAQAPAGVRVSSAEARAAAAAITRYRAGHGLGPVRVDATLNRAAAHQARAVAESGNLSHGAFMTRMQQYGAPGMAAENLSMGPRAVPEVIAQWRASSGHNAAMLGAAYARIGFARADAGRTRYWALVLASDDPRPPPSRPVRRSGRTPR